MNKAWEALSEAPKSMPNTNPPTSSHRLARSGKRPRGGGLESESYASSSLWNNDKDGANSSAEVAAGLYGRRRTNDSSTAGAQSLRSSATTTTAASNGASTTNSKRSRFSRASRTTNFSIGASSSSVLPNSHIVAVVTENKARETCVASLDAGSPVWLTITRQGNAQTYSETVAYLNSLNPDEVLLNDGRSSSQLTRKVLELYGQEAEAGVHPLLTATSNNQSRKGKRRGQKKTADNSVQDNDAVIPETNAVVKFFSRAWFDQTKGAELLKKLVKEEMLDKTVLEDYITTSAANAILNYTQQLLDNNFTAGSLFLRVNASGSRRMAIDRSSMLQLELLVNSKTGRAKNSLIGTIDKTKTTVGSHLLRVNLMSPPNDVDTINARLDLVDTFLREEDFFNDVHNHLDGLPDVDRMLSSIALVPRNKPNRTDGSRASDMSIASKGISALVCIKACLEAMPALSNILRGQLGETVAYDQASVLTHRTSLKNALGVGGAGQSSMSSGSQPNSLLRAIVVAMSCPALATVLGVVAGAFEERTTFTKDPHKMRHQQCFALKADDDGIINILRKAFLANVDDIYKTADEYAEQYDLSCNIKYTTTRGYFASIPCDQLEENRSYPFIQKTRSGRFMHCTTEELISLNTRARENIHDLLILTYDQTQEIMNTCRLNEHYDALASLCDAISILDVCHSFADTVTLSQHPWCRPQMLDITTPNQDEMTSIGCEPAEVGTHLLIRNGRFAIEVDENPQYTPNDTFSSPGKIFTTITGINGSGKSSYLRQLAIIVVLAHCGCYVPATNATIPIRNRLAARIGTEDDAENNISTFMMEMKETAFITRYANDGALILIDELGRATSNEDGVSIAWAVAEYLLKKRAMTFFVTHYPQLTRLADIYPSVQNIHLDATIEDGNLGEIRYTHKVKEGACLMESDYGVKLAALCGWPSAVVKKASQIERRVEEVLPKSGPCESDSSSTCGRVAAFQTLKEIAGALKDIKNLEEPPSVESFRKMILDLKELHLPADKAGMQQHFQRLLFPGENDIRASHHNDADDSSTSSSSSSSSCSSSSSLSSSGSDSSGISTLSATRTTFDH